jgi:hypothetical protein
MSPKQEASRPTMSFQPFNLYQFAAICVLLLGNALILSSFALWSLRLNSPLATRNMWIMICASLALTFVAALTAIGLNKRKTAWKWAAWIITSVVAAIATTTVAMFGLFALNTTTALIVCSCILGLACLVTFGMHLFDEFKPLMTKSGIELPSILQFSYSALTLTLAISVFVNVQLELARLCPSNSICSIVNITKWIVVGAAVAVVLISMIWAFVAGFRRAGLKNLESHPTGQTTQLSTTQTLQPGSYLNDAPPRIDTLPRAVPLRVDTLPQDPFVPMTIVATIPEGPPPIRQASVRSNTVPIGSTLAPTMNSFVVKRSYRADAPDEMTIMPGEQLVSLAEYADGWIFARKTTGTEYGVVPRVCLKPML